MSHDDTDETTSTDVSTSLRTALHHRPSPPPTWDLATIKIRGRQRRRCARTLPSALGLVVITAVGGIGASGGMSWPWTNATTTTVAAPDASSSPEQVVRDYLDARRAGDNARAFDDYWVPGVGARIDVTAEKLRVKNVQVGTPRPYPTTGVITQGWQQAVTVPLSYSYDHDPALVIGKAPYSGSVILVRSNDTDAWRIVSSDDSPAPTGEKVASTPGATLTPGPDPYVQPALVGLPIDGPDRPGDDLTDWRRQVRESVQRYPGTFVVPVELPADISVAFTSLWWEHPVLDVMSDGSGVIVCRDEPPACEAAMGDAPVVVVRSGEVDSTPFLVLLKPPSEPGTTGELTPAQKQYWTTVVFTSTVPEWAAAVG